MRFCEIQLKIVIVSHFLAADKFLVGWIYKDWTSVRVLRSPNPVKYGPE